METAASIEQRNQTKQAFVYQTLRNSIMRCDLPPGQRLRIEALARDLGVSPIPVREALQLLQSEGLVESVPHVGARVAGISHASVIEVFTVMEGLELVATRAAAGHIQAIHIRELMSLLEAMDQACANGGYDEWADLNAAFHCAIARITDMPLLEEMTDRALSQWDRVRRHYLKHTYTRRPAQVQAEHRTMVQAMCDQDYPLIEQVVRDHNQLTLNAYMNYLTTSRLATGIEE